MPTELRSDAQRQAEQRYNKKRLKAPAIPAIRLTADEHQFCQTVFDLFGKTKKEAVLKGLALLEDKLK